MTRTVRISEELFDEIVTNTPENMSFSDRADQYFDLHDDDYLVEWEIEELCREIVRDEIEQLRR